MIACLKLLFPNWVFLCRSQPNGEGALQNVVRPMVPRDDKYTLVLGDPGLRWPCWAEQVQQRLPLLEQLSAEQPCRFLLPPDADFELLPITTAARATPSLGGALHVGCCIQDCASTLGESRYLLRMGLDYAQFADLLRDTHHPIGQESLKRFASEGGTSGRTNLPGATISSDSSPAPSDLSNQENIPS